jgi:hypothetical protein
VTPRVVHLSLVGLRDERVRSRVRTVGDRRSAIWGGATLGLFVGVILGFFVGSSYWRTVLIAVGIGAAAGIVAEILGRVSDRLAWRAAAKRPVQVRNSELDRKLHAYTLEGADNVLRRYRPAEFLTTPDAAVNCIYMVYSVEKDEAWRAGYYSLDSFYAAHEARHPDVRVYAAVTRTFGDREDDDYDPGTWPSDVIVQRIAQLARDRSSAG